jgi:hypothetical protein
MFYLVAVILLNTVVFSLFKLFGRFQINTLQAVTVNYWVCVVTGLLTHGSNVCTPCMVGEPWLISGMLLGAYFIFLFNFMAYSTRTQGMTITTVANKISLVIPVLFSFWLYSEPATWMKLAGIALALPAVYFATKKDGTIQPKQLLVPIGIFITSGLSDTAIKFIQHTQLHHPDAQAAFTIVTFATAAALGTAFVLISLATGASKPAMKNVIAGIALGIPNYFSIYYLIRLLDADILPSSSIIPVNNVGIVITTSITAIFLFKETTSRLRIAGIVMAVIAIVLIALSGS